MKIESGHYLDKFNNQNKIFKISNGLITIILFSLTILIINLLFFTPEIHGYDEMAKWYAGKEFSEHFYIKNNHHSLRWGSWITTLIFQSFKNGPIAYYVHNLLVLHISLIIFAYVIFKLAGIVPSIIFLFVTNYNEWILWSGFQADITIETFLPLSLIILLIQKDVLKKNFYFIFFITISFYLYAVKETNIFFLPGVLYFIFRYYGIKKGVTFILIFIFFYFLETIFIKYFSFNNFSSFGRIFELINGLHIRDVKKIISSGDLSILGTSKKELTLLDIVKNRWNFPGSRLIYLINFIGFIYAFFYNNKKKILKKTEAFVMFLTLSFFFFHTFFIISINPLTPGQGFNYRYNVTIFPICVAFISILIVNIFLLKGIKLVKIFSILIFLYLIGPTLKFINTAHSTLIRHSITRVELNNEFLYDSFFSRVKYYGELKKLIKKDDYCFTSAIHQRLNAVPFILGFYPYSSPPKYEFSINEKWVHSYKKKECKNIVDLDKNYK
jgi:hypothetical protein